MSRIACIRACRMWKLVLVLLATGLCGFLATHPMIIYAHGYKQAYVFHPLRQIVHETWPGSMFGIPKDPNYLKTNWDGKWLFVDGVGTFSGVPYAPKGSVVIANLPHGLAFAWRHPGAKYDKMILPIVVPYTVIVAGIIVLLYNRQAFTLVRSRLRRRRRLCESCGYNLHGCESDKCPECGTPHGLVPPIKPPAA